MEQIIFHEQEHAALLPIPNGPDDYSSRTKAGVRQSRAIVRIVQPTRRFSRTQERRLKKNTMLALQAQLSHSVWNFTHLVLVSLLIAFDPEPSLSSPLIPLILRVPILLNELVYSSCLSFELAKLQHVFNKPKCVVTEDLIPLNLQPLASKKAKNSVMSWRFVKLDDLFSRKCVTDCQLLYPVVDLVSFTLTFVLVSDFSSIHRILALLELIFVNLTGLVGVALGACLYLIVWSYTGLKRPAAALNKAFFRKTRYDDWERPTSWELASEARTAGSKNPVVVGVFAMFKQSSGIKRCQLCRRQFFDDDRVAASCKATHLFHANCLSNLSHTEKEAACPTCFTEMGFVGDLQRRDRYWRIYSKETLHRDNLHGGAVGKNMRWGNGPRLHTQRHETVDKAVGPDAAVFTGTIALVTPILKDD